MVNFQKKKGTICLYTLQIELTISPEGIRNLQLQGNDADLAPFGAVQKRLKSAALATSRRIGDTNSAAINWNGGSSAARTTAASMFRRRSMSTGTESSNSVRERQGLSLLGFPASTKTEGTLASGGRSVCCAGSLAPPREESPTRELWRCPSLLCATNEDFCSTKVSG